MELVPVSAAIVLKPMWADQWIRTYAPRSTVAPRRSTARSLVMMSGHATTVRQRGVPTVSTPRRMAGTRYAETPMR